MACFRRACVQWRELLGCLAYDYTMDRLIRSLYAAGHVFADENAAAFYKEGGGICV